MSIIENVQTTPVNSRVQMLRNVIERDVHTKPIVLPFEMVRDAKKLIIEPVKTAKGGTGLHIDFGNGLEHMFDEYSRVSKHLSDTPIHLLQERLQTGAYFFAEIDNKPTLVDFVLNAENRFIHNDNDIQNLMNVLGVSPITNGRQKRLHKNTQMKTHYLGNAYSTRPISVGSLNQDVEGGEFNSLLRYVWSPFSQHINTAFELIRLICSNGAVGLASFLNAKVPLVNMWEQNLEIASRQIQNTVDTKVSKRLLHMSQQHASVAQLLAISSHIEKRMGVEGVDAEEHRLLSNLLRVTNPIEHLSHIYGDNVFDNKNVGAQCIGHLSKMDAFNISTELATHTNGSEESTHHAVQKIANQLMWTDRDFKTKRSIDSPFTSANNAFFGQYA